MDGHTGKVEYGLLRRLSHLLLCPRCLARGVRTPVAQVISHRHRPRALCPDCRATFGPKPRRLPPSLAIF
jgi:hypothetical protein